MNKMIKRAMTMLGVGVMTLSLLAPVTEVSAANKNKVAEIPVIFKNMSGEELEKCDWNDSKTDLDLWALGEPSAYSESYRVSYKLYIPTSFIKKDANIAIWSGLGFSDATDDDWKYGGNLELPNIDLHHGVVTHWDEEQQQGITPDYASVEKSGDFYVITYDGTTSGVPQAEDAQADVTKSEKVAIDFYLGVQGLDTTAKNCAIYFDDFKLTKADGTVIVNKDFTSDKKIEGSIHIAPTEDWDKEAKDIQIATLTDNKALTVKAAKATVKVGKTAKISATASKSVKITYTSSNKKVAMVSSKGVITGKKAGTATISVKANGKTVKVKVTVKK